MVSFDAFIAQYVEVCNMRPEAPEINCLWQALIEVNVDLYFDIYENYPEIYEEESFFKLIKHIQNMWH